MNVAASGLEFDIADSVPKSMKTKALRLVDRLRNDPAIQWNDRGELIHEGVAVAGSNIEDLVHDILRKRKTSVPVGWQKFARQLKRINLPMELVGNPVHTASSVVADVDLPRSTSTTSGSFVNIRKSSTALGILLNTRRTTTTVQSHHDHRRVSIARRHRLTRVYHILYSRTRFER